jgi:hypothetical protein
MKLIASLFACLLATAAALPAAAATLVYDANLSGANENPATSSLGTGFAQVTVDTTLLTMRVEATFTGLTGLVTASHIHCCAPAPTNVGVATQTPTFPGFPSGVTSGSYDQTFDMSLAASYNAPFVTASGGSAAGAFSALVAGMDAGQAYFNIHTNTSAGGEIRGYLTRVPEPHSLALLVVGLGFSVLAARRRLAS